MGVESYFTSCFDKCPYNFLIFWVNNVCFSFSTSRNNIRVYVNKPNILNIFLGMVLICMYFHFTDNLESYQ